MCMEQLINELLISEEYQKIKYKCLSIKVSVPFYIYYQQNENKKIDKWAQPFFDLILNVLDKEKIDYNRLTYYMIDNDKYNEIRFFLFTFPKRKVKINENEMAKCMEKRQNLIELFDDINEYDVAYWVFIYILDNYTNIENEFDWILENENFIYDKNSYNLIKINGCEFKKDGIFYDDKVYYYNPYIHKKYINQMDSMPGFAKVIEDETTNCDILYRLDENLAIPKAYYYDYTGISFAKLRGPNFDFKKDNLNDFKTITVHIDEESLNKLILIKKTVFDENTKEEFWHIEIETLPCVREDKEYILTTFIHGMYFPNKNKFTHIDLAVNRYSSDVYLAKYNDSNGNIKIDKYTNSKKEHYKIWCIENGEFSTSTWKKLVLVSLLDGYEKLFREIVD